MNQELIDEERGFLVGRLLNFGGSVLFLIGSFITLMTGYRVYNRLLTQNN